MLIAAVVLCVSCGLCFGQAYSLPPVVQLGGAVVALEQDTEQEKAASEQRLARVWLEQADQLLRKLFNNELSAEEATNMLHSWPNEGRGKQHKNKKLLKTLYPLFGAAVLAKLILLPLILKWLTALSASSFVMGKIALASAGLLALKSILSSGHARDRLEIIHSSAPTFKSYHSDLSSSDSSWMPIRRPFIPIGMSKDATFRVPPTGIKAQDLYKPFL
ncbi:uncharacterized protein LOC117791726 [Drosophila innubila]|uniref:uncharacterized protein LOC117791726 n=1 Tax=Drosophila innubila TaxID=198719 RepID=UPI00148BC793|nr:uncharacterized protein LOC117791726 [Drosophila innubila]